jgi:hypothetical protein
LIDEQALFKALTENWIASAGIDVLENEPVTRHPLFRLENVIFTVLNLLFLTMLIIFLLRQGNGAIVLEQSYAKNIALLIDSAKPVTEMKLNMEDAMNLAEKNGINGKCSLRIYSYSAYWQRRRALLRRFIQTGRN